MIRDEYSTRAFMHAPKRQGLCRSSRRHFFVEMSGCRRRLSGFSLSELPRSVASILAGGACARLAHSAEVAAPGLPIPGARHAGAPGLRPARLYWRPLARYEAFGSPRGGPIRCPGLGLYEDQQARATVSVFERYDTASDQDLTDTRDGGAQFGHNQAAKVVN